MDDYAAKCLVATVACRIADQAGRAGPRDVPHDMTTELKEICRYGLMIAGACCLDDEIAPVVQKHDRGALGTDVFDETIQYTIQNFAQHQRRSNNLAYFVQTGKSISESLRHDVASRYDSIAC